MSESEQDAGRGTRHGYPLPPAEGTVAQLVARMAERDRVTHWAIRIREETGWPWEVAHEFSERQRDRLERVAIAAELAGGLVGDPLAPDVERFMPGGAPDIRHAPLWLSCVAARLADLARELNCAELSDLAATLRDIGRRGVIVPRVYEDAPRGGEGS